MDGNRQTGELPICSEFTSHELTLTVSLLCLYTSHNILPQQLKLTCCMDKKYALRIFGSASPSGLEDSAWRSIRSSYGSSSPNLCSSMPAVTKRLCCQQGKCWGYKTLNFKCALKKKRLRLNLKLLHETFVLFHSLLQLIKLFHSLIQINSKKNSKCVNDVIYGTCVGII